MKKIFGFELDLRFLVLTLMGIVVFSPFSSDLALERLHLPMSMPELFALPFCLYFRKDIKRIRIDKKLFHGLLLLMIILILFGIIYGSFSLYAILGTARGYFWLFLFYCIFKSEYNPFSLDDLMYICLGSIFGWLLSSLFSIQNLMMQLKDFGITYGVLLAIPLFLSICFIKKKYVLLLIGITVIIMICVTSGIRRLIFISLLSVGIVSFLAVINRPSKILKVSLGIFIVSSIFLTALPNIQTFTESVSHAWYHRVFERSNIYIEGETDNSDVGRLNDITLLIEESWQYIVPPRGFVSRQTNSDKGTGDFNDLPLKELFWTFSLFGALYLLGHFSGRYIKTYRRFRRFKDEESFVIVTYMTIMFILLFLEGTFLSYPYATPITGVCLGLVDKKALIRKKI